MLYVILAVILAALTLKGYCGKRVSGFVRGTEDAFVFNFLRMLFCVFIGFALLLLEGGGGALLPEGRMLLICLVSGLSNAVFLVFWLLAIRHNSMVSVDVGLTLGSLIPSLLCFAFFGEQFSVIKLLGFLLILYATIILAGGTKSNVKENPMGIILLSLAALGDGMTGFGQQLYKHYYTDAGSRAGEVLYPKSVYHFYTYLFAALVLLAVTLAYRMIAFRNDDKKEAGKAVGQSKQALSIPGRAVFHIAVMAICLFAANYLQTVATNDYSFSSQLLYPITKGGCLITVNFVAMLFFGEPITKRSILGSLVALLGIIAMSTL